MTVFPHCSPFNPHFTSPFLCFLFQGLGMLKRASSLKEEAHGLEEEAQQLQTKGLGKIEVVVAVSEAEGFYGLLRGAIAHPPSSSAPPPSTKACHSPSATVSHLPPQESTGPKVSKPATGIAEQASEAASPAALPASEEALPAHMQPFAFSWGASNEYTDARLRDAKRVLQPHVLPFALMCARYPWW